MRLTGECRKKSSHSIIIAPSPAKRLPSHLTVSNSKTNGTCVWLSMALLLHYVGYADVARKMSDHLQQHPILFSLLSAQGLKLQYFGKDHDMMKMNTQQQLRKCIETCQTDSLVVTKLSGVTLFQTFFPSYDHLKWKRIKMSECGIDAVGVTVWEPEQYIEYLKKEENRGYYIGFLCTMNQQAFHAIAIDSINNRVYDCEETYVFYLTLEVLDICCGRKKKFRKFSSLYKLTIPS